MKKQQKKMECKISKAKPCSIPNQTLFCTVFCFIPTYYHVLVASIRWIMEKAREFQKNIYFGFIDDAKAFDCVDHNKL